MTVDPAALRYDERGLVPVVVQDGASGAVLTLAWANREAVEATLRTGQVHFWSRSRQELWRKGATSGHTLELVEATADCDADALLLRVRPAGPACHTGARTCFEPNPASLELGWLWEVLRQRRTADPAQSYTARLLAEGVERIGRKVVEEAGEVVIAGVSSQPEQGGAAALTGEAADLLYHLLLLLLARDVEPGAVGAELDRRHRARRGGAGS